MFVEVGVVMEFADAHLPRVRVKQLIVEVSRMRRQIRRQSQENIGDIEKPQTLEDFEAKWTDGYPMFGLSWEEKKLKNDD
jgi:hypothetical protein